MWEINELRGVLTGDAQEYQLKKDDHGRWRLDGTFDPFPGLAQLVLKGGLQVVRNPDGIVLRADTDSTTHISITIAPKIELAADLNEFVAWPFLGDTPGFVLQGKLGAGFELLLGEGSILRNFALATNGVSWEAVKSVRTAIFDVPLTRIATMAARLGALTIHPGIPVLADGKLSFKKVKLEFADLPELTLSLQHLRIDLSTFSVAPDDLHATLDKPVVLFATPEKPFTLVLHQGSRVGLQPALAGAGLTITPMQGRPALTALVPGCDAATAQKAVVDGSDARFVFDLEAARGESLVLGPDGLSGTARLRPARVWLGLLDCELTDGALTFADGRYEGQVTASATLPYFKNSKGQLTVRTSTDVDFSARWQLVAGQTWTDPTGNFEVIEPSATVSVKWEHGKWDVAGRVGGQLHFVGADKLTGAAKEWLSSFGDDLRLEFSDLNIGELVGATNWSVRLRPVRLPSALRLWEMFKLKFESFDLLANGFAFGGRLELGFNGLAFEARLPELACQFTKEGRIEFSPRTELNIAGRLTTPGGVSATLDLRRQDKGHVEELLGSGSVSVPSMPAIAITCALGRRRIKGKYQPVFLLYARTDYPVPLFPGVVLRNTGLGLGINKVLEVIDGQRHDEVVGRLVNGPAGWPDPGQLSSWAVPKSNDWDLSLVADTYVAPSQQGNGPFPYVGAATLYAKPTNDLVILLGANLWLLTSLEDAATAEFRSDPAVIGAMALFPRHGYLEMQARTKTQPRMSEPVPFLQQALNLASGELYLRATRDEFLFRLGPLRTGTTLAGVRLAGQIVLATYVGQRGAIAVMQASLTGAANHDASVSLRMGPLTVTAGFSFALELALETVFAGMMLSDLGMAFYARARVYVSVLMKYYLTVAFRIVLRFWRFKKTISWSRSYANELRLSLDLSLEMVVSSRPALHGDARVAVRLFGYEFAPTLKVGSRNSDLDSARDQLQGLLTYVK